MSSWDSSEWAPHAVETVAVKAMQKPAMHLAPGEFFEEPGFINDSNGTTKPNRVAHNAVRGSYPGGHASLATLLVGRQLLCAGRAPELAAK
jgi:hypothetical protein